MDIEKNRHGYYIEAGSLDYNKELSEYKEDAEMLYHSFSDKGYMVPTALTFVLRHDGVEVDGCHIWLSDGMDGLANKLQEWSRLKPYYTYDMDEWQKEDYINRRIKKYVYMRDSDWLQETFNEAKDMYECETEQELYEVFDFYNDINLSEIASYLWDVFYDSDTMYQVDNILESILGHYGDAMVAKVDDEGYYLFFN